MTSYRQVGERLGAYIRANNPSTQQVQGLLSDLLAGDELLHTMRDVASRPSFLALHPLAGSGSGASHRDALLDELSRRYLPDVIDELSQLLDGLLNVPDNTSLNAGASASKEMGSAVSFSKLECTDQPTSVHLDSESYPQRVGRDSENQVSELVAGPEGAKRLNRPAGFKSMVILGYFSNSILLVLFLSISVEFVATGDYATAILSLSLAGVISASLLVIGLMHRSKRVAFLFALRVYLWLCSLIAIAIFFADRSIPVFIYVLACVLTSIYWQRRVHGDYLSTLRDSRQGCLEKH